MVATSLAQLRSSLTWTSQIGSQVLVDGVEWTRRHLGDLRMPLLVLHGVEDKMVLVSGSRWAQKTIKISPHLITFQGNCEEGSKPGQKTGDDPGMFDKCRFWLSWKFPQTQILGPNVSFIFFYLPGREPPCAAGQTHTSGEHFAGLGDSEEPKELIFAYCKIFVSGGTKRINIFIL